MHPVPRFNSVSLILSYVADWIAIIIIAIVGAVFVKIPPAHRDFTLADPTILFPYRGNTVSIATLILVSLLAPAVIILLVCLIFVPGPTVSKTVPKSLVWRRKLWEWNTGWMGLALSLATSFVVTQGMKNLFGKPRPNMLSRCQPDVANVQKYQVGGYGTEVLNGVQLVSYAICQTTDQYLLDDGFMSFPSGHSSLSWAGLAYLTLFLCAKFAITIPYLIPGNYTSEAFPSRNEHTSQLNNNNGTTGFEMKNNTSTRTASSRNLKTLRGQAAAPPTYLLIIVLIPVCAAIYISSSRYSDYQHFGFDILFGSLLGMLTAWLSFRWYHAPIRTGAGWAWAPRSAEKAWGVGLGVQGYSGGGVKRNDDLETSGVGHSERVEVESDAEELNGRAV